MYKITLSILILLILSGIDQSYLLAQSDNPIMIIRCRFDSEEFLNNDNSNNKDVSKVDDSSFCPTFYDFQEGDCVPDCNELAFAIYGDEGLPPGYFFTYDVESGMCECQSIPSATTKESASKVVVTCEDFPFESCFDGELLVDVPMINCGSTSDALAEVEVCFSSADPSNPLLPGQQVPFQDIQNCFDAAGNPLLQAAIDDNMGPADSDEDYYFDAVVGADNKLCVTFFINPSDPIVINFTNSAAVEVVTPCAADPCSCENPDNILENGAVALFADVLSLSGLPANVNVGLTTNNNPDGFTKADGTAHDATTSFGMTDGDGNLEFPFYRNSNEAVDIEYQHPTSATDFLPVTKTFVNGMTCDATECAVIPTIGQWGLLILALILSSIGLVFIGRRRMA